MLVVSWNGWGLGRPAAFRSFKTLVRKHNPDGILIMETKVRASAVQSLVTRLGYGQMYVYPARGTSRGLCFYCRCSMDMEPILLSNYILSFIIYDMLWVYPRTFSWGRKEKFLGKTICSYLLFPCDLDPAELHESSFRPLNHHSWW